MGGTAASVLDDLERAGAARLPGFADPAVGQAMLDDVTDLVRRHHEGEDLAPVLVLPEGQATGLGERPEDRISKVFVLHERPAFAAFLRTPEVLELAQAILGPDVDCFLSQFIYKNPGAWGQPWHQDSHYFPFEPARPIVGIWLAVTEATLDNGCLHVLPGSHVEPVHPHVPDARPGANYGYVEIVDHDMAASTPVLMDPGDLLVFDSHLMHRSTDNQSQGMRAAMVFHLCKAGTVDHTGYQIVNYFVPLLRDGVAV